MDVVEFTLVAFDDTGVDILDGTFDDTFDVLLVGKTVVFIDDKAVGTTEIVVTSVCTVVVLEVFVIFRFADAAFNGKMFNILGSNVVDETGGNPVGVAAVAFILVAFVSIFTLISFADTVLLTFVVFVTQTVVLVTLVSCLLPSVNVETISQGTFSISVLPFSLIFKKQTALSVGALSGVLAYG